MTPLQDWLDRVNARWGGVGAVVTAALCLSALAWALTAILGDFW